jgi:hypothetical protein
MTILSLADYISLQGDSRSLKYKTGWLEDVRLVAQKNNVSFDNARVLEVGAGVHNPLAGALAALNLGASFAVAVEPGVLIPDHIHHALMVGLLVDEI